MASPSFPIPPPPGHYLQQQPPPWTPQPPTLSITDLRVQILANASVLLPLLHDPTLTPDRLEITTARFVPKASRVPQPKFYAMLVRRPRAYAPESRPPGLPPTKLMVLVKGKPMESEVAALEWMLMELEERMHGLAGAKDRVTEESCAIM